MNPNQVDETFLNRLKIVSPRGRREAPYVVKYPVSETQDETQFFKTLAEAETFKEQKLA